MEKLYRVTLEMEAGSQEALLNRLMLVICDKRTISFRIDEEAEEKTEEGDRRA